MNHFHFVPLALGLLATLPGLGQTSRPTTLQQEAQVENIALKATKQGHITGQAIGPNGEHIQVAFISCFANRRTKQANLLLRINSHPMEVPVKLTGFSTAEPWLKALTVNFLMADQPTAPPQTFTLTLHHIPVIWEDK